MDNRSLLQLFSGKGTLGWYLERGSLFIDIETNTKRYKELECARVGEERLVREVNGKDLREMTGEWETIPSSEERMVREHLENFS